MVKRKKSKIHNSFLRSYQKKTFLLSLFIIVLVVFGLYGMVKSNTSQNTNEKTTANWGDGTDAFYRQVIASDGEWVENSGQAIFDNKQVNSISQKETEDILAQAYDRKTQVLGLHTAADGSEKWVEIDLSDFKLYAWEGNRKVYEFSISTGRSGYETPTGEYKVWSKVRSQAYKGGSKARGDYYYLPNVPFSLFFGNAQVPNWKGYAIHGAYWHNDFGIKNRSSGCVNLKPEEAGLLYAWTGPTMSQGVNALNSSTDNPGIKIVIHE